MKIRNNLILIFSIFALIIGIIDGSLAYEEEVKQMVEYTTNYDMFTNFTTLLVYLTFRYFKYIILIQFYIVGYFNKIMTMGVSMFKSYAYGFTLTLIFVSFEGLLLFKKVLMVIIQMTSSLIVTLIFAQVTMNFLQNKYPRNQKYKIQALNLAFSLICCIIIGLIDYLFILII